MVIFSNFKLRFVDLAFRAKTVFGLHVQSCCHFLSFFVSLNVRMFSLLLLLIFRFFPSVVTCDETLRSLEQKGEKRRKNE